MGLPSSTYTVTTNGTYFEIEKLTLKRKYSKYMRVLIKDAIATNKLPSKLPTAVWFLFKKQGEKIGDDDAKYVSEGAFASADVDFAVKRDIYIVYVNKSLFEKYDYMLGDAKLQKLLTGAVAHELTHLSDAMEDAYRKRFHTSARIRDKLFTNEKTIFSYEEGFFKSMRLRLRMFLEMLRAEGLAEYANMRVTGKHYEYFMTKKGLRTIHNIEIKAISLFVDMLYEFFDHSLKSPSEAMNMLNQLAGMESNFYNAGKVMVATIIKAKLGSFDKVKSWSLKKFYKKYETACALIKTHPLVTWKGDGTFDYHTVIKHWVLFKKKRLGDLESEWGTYTHK